MKNFTKTTTLVSYLFILGCLTINFFNPQNLKAQAITSCYRADIYDFTPAERCELRNLITEFLELDTSLIVFVHQHPPSPDSFPSTHCYNEHFLSWHRYYLGLLESWLLTQDEGGKYVPLPVWNPATPIPCEFFNNICPSCSGSAIAECFDNIKNQHPSGYDFSRFFNSSSLCSYTDGWRKTPRWDKFRNGSAIDNFALDLQKEHNYVHSAIGGVMNTELASAAAIFWLFHAFLDDIYKKYECECENEKQYDLYIMDSHLDKGFEANQQTSNFYHSPDIWVRNIQDTPTPTGYSKENDAKRHQQLQSGQNYVYVRVWNIGCNTVPAGEVKLDLFASKGNAGAASWSSDWNVLPIGTPINTSIIPLPSIAPGQYYVQEIPWTPPASWHTSFSKTHACILARLSPNTAMGIDPLSFPMMPSSMDNTKKNNNIAWKNVDIYFINPFIPNSPPVYELEIIQPSYSSSLIKLEFAKVSDFDLSEIILSADPSIMTSFLTQGTWQGMNLITVGSTPSHFEITADTASICNLNFPIGQSNLPITMQFDLSCSSTGGSPCAKYGDVFEYDVRQYAQEQNGDELLGGNRYEIRIEQSPETNCGTIISDAYIEYPEHENDPSGLISLTLAGQAPYTFYWCHGENTAGVAGLLPDKYEVTVVDANNCIETACYDLYHLSNLEVEFEVETISCGDSICVKTNVTGGTPPYTYNWKSGKQDTVDCDLFKGLRSVTITDAQGRIIIRKINVANHMQLASISDATFSPHSANNGIAYAETSGGQPPYMYHWNTGATTDTINNLAPGDYFVTITDALSCTTVDTVRVSSVSYVSPKVFLQGALNNFTMNDDLRANNLLPTTDPYGLGQATHPNVMNVTGNNAITDWVVVEVRDPSSPTTIIQSTAALLQRNGNVVHTDGTSAVPFYDLPMGAYYIVIKHRNHLSVMTSMPVVIN